MDWSTAGIALLMFAAALLYSSVGHAGASGYLAVMALFGVAPLVMKPTALSLNIIVATIGTAQFYRAGYFNWKLFWPMALTSVPMAFVGGSINLSVDLYRIIIGIVLLFAAWRIFPLRWNAIETEATAPPMLVSLGIGGFLGFLSGLTGVGGGIFLTPMLLLMHWAQVKEAAAVSAAFILVNSISGLAGNWANIGNLLQGFPYLAGSVIAGGLVGSYLGTKKFDGKILRTVLSLVLVIAGLKLILT